MTLALHATTPYHARWPYEPFIREELGWLDHDETEWRAALQLYDKMSAPAQAERLQAELDRR